MKINKLLGLGEFVNAVDKFPLKGACQFNSVNDYNKYLKKDTSKEMFVNPITEPLYDNYETLCEFRAKHDRWQVARDKVIFTNWRIIEDSRYNDHVYLDGHKVAEINFQGKWIFKYKTLYDLAEATNGELSIKPMII